MSVSAALAELGSREALIALAVNGGAEIADFSLRRMIERFGSDGEMREALLSRPHLPAALRSVLVALTAPALSNFVTSRSWLSSERAERVTREARESANIMISAETARDGDHAGACELVAYLRTTGQLTAGLILRSLFCGHTNLFEAALCALSTSMYVMRLDACWRAFPTCASRIFHHIRLLSRSQRSSRLPVCLIGGAKNCLPASKNLLKQRLQKRKSIRLRGVILHECEEHLLTASAGRGEFLATERSAP
jgi:uncharacterized protein DUF2336